MDRIYRKSFPTPSGNAVSFFYNYDRGILTVDLVGEEYDCHGQRVRLPGGNELLRLQLDQESEDRRLAHLDLPPGHVMCQVEGHHGALLVEFPDHDKSLLIQSEDDQVEFAHAAGIEAEHATWASSCPDEYLEAAEPNEHADRG